MTILNALIGKLPHGDWLYHSPWMTRHGINPVPCRRSRRASSSRRLPAVRP